MLSASARCRVSRPRGLSASLWPEACIAGWTVGCPSAASPRRPPAPARTAYLRSVGGVAPLLHAGSSLAGLPGGAWHSSSHLLPHPGTLGLDDGWCPASSPARPACYRTPGPWAWTDCPGHRRLLRACRRRVRRSRTRRAARRRLPPCRNAIRAARSGLRRRISPSRAPRHARGFAGWPLPRAGLPEAADR